MGARPSMPRSARSLSPVCLWIRRRMTRFPSLVPPRSGSVAFPGTRCRRWDVVEFRRPAPSTAGSTDLPQAERLQESQRTRVELFSPRCEHPVGAAQAQPRHGMTHKPRSEPLAAVLWLDELLAQL